MCFCGVFIIEFWNISKMDAFSLEEDDGNELFITQQSNSKDIFDEEKSDSDGDLLGIGIVDGPSTSDGASVPHYSDISDDENDFEKPRFQ